MQIELIKCLLFLLTIGEIEGLGKRETQDYFTVNQRTMKKILESCYKNSSLSGPIVIFGDFNEPIDERSIIRIDRARIVNAGYGNRQLLEAKASTIILIVDSSRELILQLSLLSRTRWWNPKVPHFIIDNSNRPCKNVANALLITWRENIINSIYICTTSMKKSTLFTMNAMANYAPYPWQLATVIRSPPFYMSIFYRVSDTNTSCEYLNYDKTKLLQKYPITMVAWPSPHFRVTPRFNYLNDFNTMESRHIKLLRSIIKSVNAQPRFELENDESAVMHRLLSYTADIRSMVMNLGGFSSTLTAHFPHDEDTIVAVVRLKPEVTTLEKIRKLWSVQVLIFAAISLTFLIVVLTIISHDFPAAMLDTIRLLIYSSILINNRTHPFRIYLTTMLIFMVISNGVFQGKIAAFLTTEERGTAFGTINELMKKQYKMYAYTGLQGYLQMRLPEYDIKTIEEEDECVQLVLNNINHVCFIAKSSYEQRYILYPLECVKEEWTSLLHFQSRQDWPLADRFNDMIMRHVESGIVNFWKMNDTLQQIRKRQEKEAEWSSPQYKPVRLYKLTFAFQLLAIGLSLSTFVVFLELLVAKYGTRWKSFIIDNSRKTV